MASRSYRLRCWDPEGERLARLIDAETQEPSAAQASRHPPTAWLTPTSTPTGVPAAASPDHSSACVRAVGRSMGRSGNRSSTASTKAPLRARRPGSAARCTPWSSSQRPRHARSTRVRRWRAQRRRTGSRDLRRTLPVSDQSEVASLFRRRRASALQIVRCPTRTLCDPREHARPDLIAVMECEHEVRPSRAFQSAM